MMGAHHGRDSNIYPLVMCYIAMEAMAILDLSLLKMVIFHNSYVIMLVYQRVT